METREAGEERFGVSGTLQAGSIGKSTAARKRRRRSCLKGLDGTTAKWRVAAAAIRIVGRGKTCRFAKDVPCMGMTGRTVTKRGSRRSTRLATGALTGLMKHLSKGLDVGNRTTLR